MGAGLCMAAPEGSAAPMGRCASGCALVLLALVGSAGPAWGEGPRCAAVDNSVEALYSTPLKPEPKVMLGPVAPERVVPALLAAARSSTGAASRASFLALGFSRHATALKALRDLREVGSGQRLGRALALLALGDGSESGTVAWALYRGPVEVRRSTARVLAEMEQSRPRRMLFEAMLDEDPQVRLTAAEVQIHRYSRRARRVLHELMVQGPEPLVAPAAQALYATNIPFRTDELQRLPDPLKGPMQVRLHMASRRRSAQSLKGKLPSTDRFVRAGAFAALAVSGDASAAVVRRFAKVALAARGASAEAQLRMCLALMGDAEAIETLVALQGEEARAAVDVFWAFSGARASDHRLDAEHAAKLARGVESWLQRGFLDPVREAQVIEALHRADPLVGLQVARRRLVGGPGAGWQAALEVVRLSGIGADSDALLRQLPTLAATDAARALRVARAVCAR